MPVAESSQPEGGADTPRFRSGDVLRERYRFLDCIGVGAMGSVWRAHDELLDADVAVKVIRVDPERVAIDRVTRRLLTEARAIARISHPGIVRVFDFGVAEGLPFIVMELLEGESLDDLLAREGPTDAISAVRMLLPIADAVSLAHRRGIVHRDLKPENVFLARDEFGRVIPKLVDFGVARMREGGAALTRPGALMGTPDYMAPEQAEGASDVDPRADIWAFAVVLYELASGRRPFAEHQSSYLAILRSIVGDAPTPLTAHGSGDDELWAILEKALAKRRDDRYQDLRELGEALARWLLARGESEDFYGTSLRTAWLSCEPKAESAPLADSGASATLRRVDPSEPAEEGTLPPPALARPPMLALPAVPRPAYAPRRAASTSQVEAIAPAARPGFAAFERRGTRGHTLESALLPRFTELKLMLASVLVASVTAASIAWLVASYRAARQANAAPNDARLAPAAPAAPEPSRKNGDKNGDKNRESSAEKNPETAEASP